MKKLVWLSVLFVFLYTHQSFAAPSLAVSATGTVISATLSNIPATTDTFQLLLQTTPFATGGYTGTATPAVLGSDPTQQAPVVIPPSTLGTATWSLGPYLANTTYYVEVVQIPSFQNSATEKAVYATNPTSITTQAATIPFLPLTASVSGKTIIISGKIDTTKISNFTTTAFSPTLEYSASPATNTTTGALSSPINPPLKPDSSVGSDGSYTWTVSQSGFTPSTTYYFQQTVADSAGNSKIDIVVNVDSSSGNIVAAGVTGSTLSSSTYTLLSGGFPGLVSIPSAQQCATEQATATAQGKTPPICSVNDLLNYAMQLLIGLCGVVLVLRLMYEGYIYMVTDVPFLKASSKSGFMTALLGLLLALTSYVILNTINPKLVSETVNVTPLAIGVDGDSDTPTVSVTGATSQIPGGISCPGTGRSAAVTAIAQSFVGKVTYTFGGKDAATQSNGYSLLDCSGWANTVLSCAGYSAPKDYTNSGSADIFSGAEKVNMSSGFVISGSDVLINNIKLTPGSLVGWPTVGSAIGHVILYVGNGTFMDSHAGTSPGQAIGTFSASQLQSLYGGSRSTKTITSVKRTPL
jgi:cell wall-associated NlpC family hydrolase